jgi:phosphopentomutase
LRAERFKRVIWMVLDSVGIGAMPDAAEFGDEGRDTLGNIAKQRNLKLPNLCGYKTHLRFGAREKSRRCVRKMRTGFAR